jgi:uncharacterized membrane protein YgdD (TMEM256/DUF423 family)
MNSDVSRLRVAACVGFLAVALGAFGAHSLTDLWKKTLPVDEVTYRLGVWHTAESYHLVHAVALAALAMSGLGNRYPWVWRSWLVGIIVFSGSLYTLCLTGLKWWGGVTPIGGVALLAGWLLLAIRPKGET